MRYFYTTASPIGDLIIAQKSDALTHIELLNEEKLKELKESGAVEEKTDLISTAVSQLDEYFAGKRREFTLPLAPEGTDFQKRDWQALCDIPYGETASYKDIAIRIGCPKGARAVGLANNRNPIMIVIPCHRVIGSDGSLVGYEGGLHIKEYLLKLEGAIR